MREVWQSWQVRGRPAARGEAVAVAGGEVVGR